ncbi:hypothetical protein C8R46DRAFT_1289905 [Mycena filopes]|nr:hypothetical protein C8R46DRAFT_1289905 [Mycena filopes]
MYTHQCRSSRIYFAGEAQDEALFQARNFLIHALLNNYSLAEATVFVTKQLVLKEAHEVAVPDLPSPAPDKIWRANIIDGTNSEDDSPAELLAHIKSHPDFVQAMEAARGKTSPSSCDHYYDRTTGSKPTSRKEGSTRSRDSLAFSSPQIFTVEYERNGESEAMNDEWQELGSLLEARNIYPYDFYKACFEVCKCTTSRVIQVKIRLSLAGKSFLESEYSAAKKDELRTWQWTRARRCPLNNLLLRWNYWKQEALVRFSVGCYARCDILFFLLDADRFPTGPSSGWVGQAIFVAALVASTWW